MNSKINLFQFAKESMNNNADYIKISIKASLLEDITSINSNDFNNMYENTLSLPREELNKHIHISTDVVLDDIDYLNCVFTLCNVGPTEILQKLNYSMSCGDIVQISNKFYICKGIGWEEIILY